MTSLVLSDTGFSKEVYAGTAWSTEGLSVTGYYSDEKSADLTSSATFDFNPATVPSDIGTTSVAITATFEGLSSNELVIDGINVVEVASCPKITAVGELVEGGTYYIGTNFESAGETINVMGAQSESYRSRVSYTTQIDGEIIPTEEMAAITLGKRSSDGAYILQVSDGYLSYSSGNSISTTEAYDASNDELHWNISISSGSSGSATISNVGSSDRNLRYNSASPRFACYTSTQTSVCLYGDVADSSSIAIDQDDSSLYVGDTLILSASLVNLSGTPTWSSSDSEVASVSGNGTAAEVTGLAEGTVEITVSLSGHSDTILVTVAEAPVYAHEFVLADFANVDNVPTKFAKNTLDNSRGTGSNYFYLNYTVMKEASPEIWDDSERGVQFGTSSKPVSELSLASGLFVANDGITNEYLISQIKVNAATVNDLAGKATISVYVDGVQAGTTKILSAVATDYTFVLSTASSGHIEVVLDNPTQTGGALYLKSIEAFASIGSDGSLMKVVKELEALDSCAITSEEWTAFLNTKETEIDMTYADIIEVYKSEMESITIYDKTSSDRSGELSALTKYEYIDARVGSNRNLANLNIIDDGSLILISVFACLSLGMVLATGLLIRSKRRRA